jgi:hypothetical protein
MLRLAGRMVPDTGPYFRVVAVVNAKPADHGSSSNAAYGGRILRGNQRWTTEWSTTLASPLSNPSRASSRLISDDNRGRRLTNAIDEGG